MPSSLSNFILPETTTLLMAGQSGGDTPAWVSLLPWLLIILVFYFFMIKPQMKKAKQEREFRANLEKDDKVVTIGGIHGKIVEVKDSHVILSVEDGTRLRVEKNAISMNSTTQLTEQQKA